MVIILKFFEICFFKASPADIPASSWLMKLTVLAYLVVSMLVNSFENSFFISLSGALTEVLVLLITMHLLLLLTRFPHRYQQTVTAMAGTSCCIGIIALPVMALFHFLAGGVDVRITVLAVWLMILLMLWNLAVTMHIFKQAMSLSSGAALVTTVLYTAILIFAVRIVLTGLA